MVAAPEAALSTVDASTDGLVLVTKTPWLFQLLPHCSSQRGRSAALQGAECDADDRAVDLGRDGRGSNSVASLHVGRRDGGREEKKIDAMREDEDAEDKAKRCGRG